MSWIQRIKNALIQDDPYPRDLSRLDRMDGLGTEPKDARDDDVAARGAEA